MSPTAKEKALREAVARRAEFRCEYCRLPERCTSLPFQLDHVTAEKHAGETSLDNLAHACLHCNSFKGPNLAGRDKETDEVVRLTDAQVASMRAWKSPSERPLMDGLNFQNHQSRAS